eukprot:6175020-Pleurochrysis_carterae.AAC.1
MRRRAAHDGEGASASAAPSPVPAALASARIAGELKQRLMPVRAECARARARAQVYVLARAQVCVFVRARARAQVCVLARACAYVCVIARARVRVRMPARLELPSDVVAQPEDEHRDPRVRLARHHARLPKRDVQFARARQDLRSHTTTRAINQGKRSAQRGTSERVIEAGDLCVRARAR